MRECDEVNVKVRGTRDVRRGGLVCLYRLRACSDACGCVWMCENVNEGESNECQIPCTECECMYRRLTECE